MASGDNDRVVHVANTLKQLRFKENRQDSMEDSAARDGSEGSSKIKADDSKLEKEKLGHRRVDTLGEVTYKKIQTSQIMGSIQLGIQHAVGGLASKPERDLLMQDFMTVETTTFPPVGTNLTPAHHYPEFVFKTYAPIAFRYFRDLFGIQPDDFLISFCSAPLRELSNPGASGSIFYLTEDDKFIIKTVQHKEGEFLQRLLPGYYMNLNQNPQTLMPKFFGLYCYQCNSKNIRMVAMNNLIPSSLTINQKYDLKGSTYKRKASKTECQKSSPTYKDLDFMDHYPEGIFLVSDTYTALIKTIQRDCMVLESFKIMDYSLLLGIHNIDQAARIKTDHRSSFKQQFMSDSTNRKSKTFSSTKVNKSYSSNRERLVAHSTAVQAESELVDEDENVSPEGVAAQNSRGERLLLFIGIIDILQSYRLKKKLEHMWKSILHDGDTISVHRPKFYAERFQNFMAKAVFKKSPLLKYSSSKRKTISKIRTVENSERLAGSALPISPPALAATSPLVAFFPPSYPSVLKDRETENTPHGACVKVSPPILSTGTQSKSQEGAVEGSPVTSIPSCSTPPPSFHESIHVDFTVDPVGYNSSSQVPPSIPYSHETKKYRDEIFRFTGHTTNHTVFYQEDSVSISAVRLESQSGNKSCLSVESGSSTSGIGTCTTGRYLMWTPPVSVEGSTPTWTEGTPSFTESSSGDPVCPMSPVGSFNRDKYSSKTIENTQNCTDMTQL